MKVEELIIDGFKSYATRTVISGWDSSFNCITGLNGSGKSNILDAICFVLGITTMSTVRAQNLQDLIYKRGQAGVTKASVTIVFDNSDKDKSPLGFEDQSKISVTRQIVLGGTNKFLINGHRAQQQSIQQLFQSVQLNINNPNFLIMQGRITKVLNMKPAEILSLIEEAAGTRMFEDRREKAISTMTKKQKKVDEIHGLLREEIEPKLENLRNEKRMFLEYQKALTNLERMQKLVGSYDYVRYTQLATNQEAELTTKREKLQELSEAVEKSQSEIASLAEDITALRTEKQSHIQKGGKVEVLEKKAKELQQEAARIKTLSELKHKNVTEEQAAKEALVEKIERLTQRVNDGQSIFSQAKDEYDNVKSELEAIDLQISKQEELLQSLQTGVSSKAGDEGGYASQLQAARAKANQAKTAAAQADVRIKHLQKSIKEDEPKTRKAEIQNQSMTKELDESQQELTNLRTKMEKAGWQPGKLEQLKAQESKLSQELRQLVDALDEQKRTVSNVDFHYSRPSSTFNPASVKGLVAQLFTLGEDQFDKSTAVEVTAGGRLFQVVVDTDVTASQLLNKGQLKRRVTIIPLNKISAFKLSAERIGAAKNLAPGKVNLALDLIGYDNDVAKAMEYVFGGTLICKDAETAKLVTFNPNVRAKTVTLDGDVYDPNGTLSGGSNNRGGRGNSNGSRDSLLMKLQKVNTLNTKVKNLRVDLEYVQSQVQAENELTEKLNSLKTEMELKEHSVELLRKKLEDSPGASLWAKFESRKKEIADLTEQIKDNEAIYASTNIEIEAIENDMAEFKNNRGGKLEELKNTIGELRKERERINGALRQKLSSYQNVQVETEQVRDEITGLQEHVQEKESSIKEQTAALSDMEAQLNQAIADEQQVAQVLEEERASLLGIDEELGSMESLASAKKQFVTECGLEMQKMTHDLEKASKDAEQAQDIIHSLEEKYEWIQDQKPYFGQEGTAYAFNNVDIKECRTNLKKFDQLINGMKKNVNSKVMNMIENVEKKEASLQGMINTIEKDKKKIEETIESLDEYKRKALMKTWEKVSVDFGKIFSDLLPNSFAKLVPPEGQNVTDGLEVKVALGGVWKDGLAELSGGQRSLIALSLILALLQFKPAPMYILDEVDAALDLHHTQNIGQIIKTRFQGSQFIVVSLKEGMFTNANRVFRARFQEGTSTVSVM